MHLNYYFLKQLVKELEPILIGSTLVECYSQSKDEIVFGFTKNEQDIFIKAIFNGSFSLVSFPKDSKRARRNSIDLFTQLNNKQISKIYTFENERSFCVELENEFSLVFKLHGNRSNILLFDNEQLITLFRNDLISDKSIKIATLNRPINQSHEAIINSQFNLQEIYPTFGKQIKKHLATLNFSSKSEAEKLKTLDCIIEELNNSKIHIYQNDGIPYLHLLEQNKTSIYETNSPMEACNYLASNYLSCYYFHREKKQLTSELSKALKKTNAYITKSLNKYESIKTAVKHEELANIIMANLHLQKHHITSIELFDFYRNENITIKLKKDLSLQKNAENYYRKGKKQQFELDTLLKNINAKRAKKEKIKQELDAINELTELKALRKYSKSKPKKSKAKEQIGLPYTSLDIDGFTVMIGRSAKNNDELISRYTSKNDLWLHARGVSGSHVVIKQKHGFEFNSTVIEKAASLAAWNSKGKNDSLCPVIYTPRKYIRKPKGGLPGQIIVEKEEVILVKPCRKLQ